MKTTLGSVAAAIAVLAVSGCASTAPAPAGGGLVAADEAGRAAQEIRRACLARPRAEAMSCHEEALLGVLREEGVRPAMTVLDRLAEADAEIRRDGHVYAHVIGLAAFTTAEEVGETYASCTPAFQSGCYHGVIQSYFVDHGAAARRPSGRGDGGRPLRRLPGRRRAALAALPVRSRAGARPDHGRRLPPAARAGGVRPGGEPVGARGLLRRRLHGEHRAGHRAAPHGGPAGRRRRGSPRRRVARPPRRRRGSAAGHAGHDAHAGHGDPAPEPFRGLDPADPHYPCSILDARYLRSCYQMQTSAVLFFEGGDFAAAVRLCREAPELYRDVCYESLGRDVSSYVQQDHSPGAPHLRRARGAPRALLPRRLHEEPDRPDGRRGRRDRLLPPGAGPGLQAGLLPRRGRADRGAGALAGGARRGCAAVEPGFAPACRYGAGLTDERPALPTGGTREAAGRPDDAARAAAAAAERGAPPARRPPLGVQQRGGRGAHAADRVRARRAGGGPGQPRRAARRRLREPALADLRAAGEPRRGAAARRRPAAPASAARSRCARRSSRPPFYRLVFGEGDGLPGLVVDRFGDVLVAQITTAGMERLRDEVVAALAESWSPAPILLRNDTASRALEGLERYVEPALGTVPERVEIEENGVRFEVLPEGRRRAGSTTTGEPRAAAAPTSAAGACWTSSPTSAAGACRPPRRGAREVVCVDSSAPALEAAERSAALNGVEGRCARCSATPSTRCARCATRGSASTSWCSTPPPSSSGRRTSGRASRRTGGSTSWPWSCWPRTASSSPPPAPTTVARRPARHHAPRQPRGGRELQILEEGHQGPDHPVHPAIPETRYLKAFIGRLA
jgi:23S rRNA (cytosine1962-C5)-methyltransferase